MTLLMVPVRYSYTYGEPVIGAVQMSKACLHLMHQRSLGCVTFNNTEVKYRPIQLYTFLAQSYYHSATGRRAEYCDECVCLSVCLFARMSEAPHVRTSSSFLCMLPAVVTLSFSVGFAISYILPVWWMTSCIPAMVHLAG